MTRRLKLSSLLCTTTFMVSACVSVLPEQPKPEAVYRLSTPLLSLTLDANVVILEPDAPRLFASRALAAESSDGGLKLVPGVAWADRSTRLLQTTMVDTFSADGAGIAVDDAAGMSGDYELYWRVTDFSLKGNDGACRLQLTLMDGRTRAPIAQTTVSSTAKGSGSAARSRALALADAGRNCVAEGARFVAEHALEAADAAEN